MTHDYHTHSNYSDGAFLHRMVGAAESAGLDGVGIADHCAVSGRDGVCEARARLGFNLDLTYERRRRAIEALRGEHDVAVYDAVEVDYHPDDEARIAAFLDDAGFDYALGSVHELDGRNVQAADAFADYSRAERAAAVDRYFDRLVALADSGLFEVAAHPDLVERNPHLRGLATPEQYRRVAAAFAGSRTVPEINAGRVLDDYGEFHPHPAFLDVLVEESGGVTVGTDAHASGELAPRVEALETVLANRGIDPVAVHEL